MKPLHTLAVTFDIELSPWELTQFRGAVAAKVGLEHEWFHNHNNDTGGVHFRYPLIQYKIDTHDGKMRPMLLCINEGVEAANYLFRQDDWGMKIGNQTHDMPVYKIYQSEHCLQLVPQPLSYRIHKWKPFNTENFAHWQTIKGIAQQFAFLERLLATHIIAFADSVEWQIPEQFEIIITKMIKDEIISHKSVKSLVFSLEFDTKVSLPNYIGLGKAVALGFGVIRRQRQT